jgi:hypothetical protein
MNETLKNWLTAIAAIAALTGVGYLLDGPSAAEVEAAQAADLADAQAQAHRDAPQVRAEMARLDAERIEPTPAAILHRYALLEAGK